jgi:hypothetical protein
MAKVNVSVPEDLKARLEAANLPLSPLARECWEAALARAELEEGEVVMDAIDGKTGEEVELEFTGSLIAESGYNGAKIYLTNNDELVWIFEDETYEVGPREETNADEIWNFLRDGDAAADACRALGIKRVVRL